MLRSFSVSLLSGYTYPISFQADIDAINWGWIGNCAIINSRISFETEEICAKVFLFFLNKIHYAKSGTTTFSWHTR